MLHEWVEKDWKLQPASWTTGAKSQVSSSNPIQANQIPKFFFNHLDDILMKEFNFQPSKVVSFIFILTPWPDPMIKENSRKWALLLLFLEDPFFQRSLQNIVSQKLKKNYIIWFDEFFENTSSPIVKKSIYWVVSKIIIVCMLYFNI